VIIVAAEAFLAVSAMTIAGLLLLVAGVVMTASTLFGSSFDFAIAVRKGWHVTIFPPPRFVGVLAIVIGFVLFMASRRGSE
jgi:hypothetical protein